MNNKLQLQTIHFITVNTVKEVAKQFQFFLFSNLYTGSEELFDTNIDETYFLVNNARRNSENCRLLNHVTEGNPSPSSEEKLDMYDVSLHKVISVHHGAGDLITPVD